MVGFDWRVHGFSISKSDRTTLKDGFNCKMSRGFHIYLDLADFEALIAVSQMSMSDFFQIFQ